MPAAVRRAWTAIGAAARRDAADHAGQVPRASLEVGDLDGGDALGLLVGLGGSAGGLGERDAGRRRGLAGDAEDREEVGPVRRHLDVEHRVVEPEPARATSVPGSTSAGRIRMPSCDGRDAELVGRARACRSETTPRISLAAERLGQDRDPRAGRRERHHVARRPCCGRRRPPRARREPRLHAGEAELVGVRVVADLEHPRRDHAGQARPGPLDRLDLGALAR